MSEQAGRLEQFEAYREYLHAVAYRMLGDHAEADDAVQEAWLRLQRTGEAPIDSLRAWLTTVIARVCLDMLRSRRARDEQPLEILLADIHADPGAQDPLREASLAESVGLALYVVLDTLSPAERLVFVLHDLFAVPLDAVALTLGRTPTATKQLAHRARRRVRLPDESDRVPTGPQADRSVVSAFFAAARRGDFDALVAVLDPDVVLRAQGADTVELVRGAAKVAARASMFARPEAHLHAARIGDEPGVVVTVSDRVVSMMSFTIADGRVRSIESVLDPAHLAAVVPSWVR